MNRKVKRYKNGGDIEDDDISLEQTGGFGRAAVQEAAKRPTFASTVGQLDERDRREETMASMAKNRPAKTKAPIVTKEQMKKAGFDNLRDYLNAQRGLTRRGSKQAAPAKPTFSKVDPDLGKGPSSEQIEDLERRAAISNAFRGPKLDFSVKNEVDPRVLRSMQRAGGMKSGGKVSASKRADGCAQRGKTKGRMV